MGGVDRRTQWRGFGEAWTSVGTLLSGAVVWGGLGWLVDSLVGSDPLGMAIGAVVGIHGGVYLTYIRARRQTDEDA